MSVGTVAEKTPKRALGSMQSPVLWALLGLVIERPSYGYELAHRFEHTYAGMLQLSGISYIYTALDTLRCRGLIEEIAGTRTGRQPKPRYRVTPGGLRSYQERLIAQMREDFRRSRLFARQLAVFAHEPEIALDVIERYGQACLEEASDTPVHPPPDADTPAASGLASRLVSEERRLTMEARLPWIDYARREFKALAACEAQGQ
jgi:DNA-binding PadR family transcriptional regulator